MSDDPLPQYKALHYNDEISISDLLLKLWAKRGLIVVLPLLFAGVTVVALLVSKTFQQTSVSFYIELVGISHVSPPPQRFEDNDGDPKISTELTLETRYPNGSIFSPQDLTSPGVVKLLSQETGLPGEALAEHIDVQFGTPVITGILDEYRAALAANSKATVEELALLNSRYDRKINATAKRGLKISVDFVELGISKDDGVMIAERLPSLWNQVYTEQVLTRLPAKISGLRWTDDLHDLTSTIGLQEAILQIDALTEGVNLIIADERLIGLKNANGVTASDIFFYIKRFRSIYFEPLFLAAFESDVSLTEIYQRDIVVEIAKIDSEIDELNSRLSSLRRNSMTNTTSTNTPRQEFGTGLDAGAFSQVVALAEQAASARYIESSLEERFKLVEAKAELQARLSRINTNPEKSSASLSNDFVKAASTRYQVIVSGYSELLRNAKEALSKSTPTYYSVVTRPDVEGSLTSVRDLIFLLLSICFGFMVGISAALVWPTQQLNSD